MYQWKREIKIILKPLDLYIHYILHICTYIKVISQMHSSDSLPIVVIHGGGSSLIQVKICWPIVIDRVSDKKGFHSVPPRRPYQVYFRKNIHLRLQSISTITFFKLRCPIPVGNHYDSLIGTTSYFFVTFHRSVIKCTGFLQSVLHWARLHIFIQYYPYLKWFH